MKRVAEDLTANARALRNGATDAERILWRLLSRYRPPFTRQLVIGRYIADISCREAKLLVELDGSQHLGTEKYDAARTAYLASEGWHVIRFWNNEVIANPEVVATRIVDEAALRLDGVVPAAVASRAGRERKPRYR